MTPTAAPVDLRTPGRGPLRLYAVIVVLYGALITWWVLFFARQGETLVERLEQAGGAPNAAAREALREATREWSRMFLFEGAFLGLLLAASMVLVARSFRREVALARRQRDFVSAVTHELRSPLASIRLYLDSLLLGRAEGEKARRYLTHAREDADRLSRLVEEVLTTRALAEGAHEVRLEPVDMAAVVAHRVMRLGDLHPGASLQVHTPEPVWVRADTDAVERILDNLVSNAVKYAGDQGPVRIRVKRTGQRGVLSVLDAGPGLRGADPDELTEAFSRGQAEDVRTHPGVGLGLFVVRSLCEAQGGRLLFSEDDHASGLTVSVTLPGAPSPDDPAPAPEDEAAEEVTT